MMGDRSGIGTDADTAVEGGVAEPDRPVFLALVQHLPESDMVTMVGAVADRLLESKILATAKVEQGADRRVPIRAIQQHAADDLDGRAPCHGIGRIPAGGM